MSVDLQTAHSHEQFGVNSTQFEEIVPNNDERSSRSNRTSKIEKMAKNSDSDERSNYKDKNKEPLKSPLNSDYSSDGDSSYEDDFEETEAPSPTKPGQKAVSRKSSPGRSQGHSSRSPEHSTIKSPSVISPRSSKKSQFTKTYKAYKSPRSSDTATTRQREKSWAKSKNRSANVKVSQVDHSVFDRVLSANRNKVVKLESRLAQLVKELTMEREENKTLRQIHYRQEKELIKVHSEEAGLPQLIKKHTTEVTSLRETNRRLRDTIGQQESKLNDLDKKILKLQDRNKHYKELCEMKNLPEREESQKQLTQAEKNLEKRDAEISKLQRMLNLKEKAHSRQMKELKEKLRQTDARLKDMEENCHNLQSRNEGMKTQLDYLNIYQRQIVLKEKNNLTKVLPEGPPKMAALPAPKRPKPKKTNNNNKNKNNDENNNKKEDITLATKETTVNKKTDSVFLTAQSDTGSDKELDKSGNEAARNDKLLSITDGTDVLDMSDLNREITLSEDELTKEKERRKKEEFERSLREEDERLKKEKEEADRIKKEEEERLERQRAEREAKWREDSAKREREEEGRRKESARRAREEEEKRKAEEAKEKEAEKREDSFFEDEELRKKKELLLARMKAIDNAKGSADEDAYHSDSKRLSSGKSGEDSIKSRGFRKADENLHNGLPALGKESSLTSPPVSVKSDPDSIVGIPRYKPVLVGRGNLTKKPSQFSWLEDNKKPAVNNNKTKPNDDFNFGDYSPSMSDTKKKPADLNNDIFGTGISRKPARGRRGHVDNGFDFGERRGSDDKPKNNLSFLSDDFGSTRKGELRSISPTNNNEPLLPRRRKAQERGGPAISSVFDDNLDDDIEELAL